MKSSRAVLLLASLLMVVGTLFPAASGRADDPEPEVSTPAPERTRWDRMLAVEVVGGVDTPYGLIGAAVVVSPIRNLALDLGGGYSRDGGRVAGGARLVLPHENAAFGLRVGFAGGPLTWQSAVAGQPAPLGSMPSTGDSTQTRTWDFVGFLDVSLSLEVRFDMGMYLRFDFGVEHSLAGADRCVETDGGTCTAGGYQPTRSYVGLALGYAFDI